MPGITSSSNEDAVFFVLAYACRKTNCSVFFGPMSEMLSNPEVSRQSLLDRLKKTVTQIRVNRMLRVAQYVPVETQGSVFGYDASTTSSESDSRLVTHLTTQRKTPYATTYTTVKIEKGDEISGRVSRVTATKEVVWNECGLRSSYSFDSLSPQDSKVGFTVQDVHGEISDATRLLYKNSLDGFVLQLPEQ